MMDRLPQHVILAVVRFAVAQPEPNISVLSVCSDFYLAAIPILYHSPRMSSRYDSFFLHPQISVLPPGGPPMPALPEAWAEVSALSARELVRLGYTKLAALRYTHHLHTIIPDYRSSMPKGENAEERAAAVIAAQSTQQKELNAAEKLVKSLGRGVLSGIEVMQVEEAGSMLPARTGRRAHPFGFHMELLNNTDPLIWCRNPAATLPVVPRSWKLADCLDPKIPPARAITHLHAYMSGILPIVPGQTTYIHLHPSQGQGDGDICPPEGRPPLVWLGQQLYDMLDSYLQEESVGDQCKVLERTPIIIGASGWGDKPLQVLAGGIALGGGDSGSPKTLQQIADRIKFVITDTTDGYGEAYSSLNIEVRRTEDMPRCPACGRGV